MEHRQDQNNREELRAKFTVWLEKLVYRAKIDYIRKYKRYKQVVSIEKISDSKFVIDSNEVVDSNLQKKFYFQNEKLEKAFSSLSPVRKKILEMIYINGLSAEEISKELNCTVQNVYNQHSIALKILRCKLNKGK